ncbi:beta-lactamase/transpeptidase-like protein [Dichotomopilus funicola]|uniref:Beta-lactamase/transpeptidase-like protein n=1 Tax=Dichotomopilus funicola TaxID=1934379 RepID=A0AAN6UVC8_9PEZI|nr:beta-lactamase/transpeptidase-like protein [Dichotomopilus funicola]
MKRCAGANANTSCLRVGRVLDLLDALKSNRGKIKQICKASGVAGASVVVIDHGETIFKENFGYRHIANKEPVTSDTIFRIASLTKSFMGACIDRLRAQGKLSLDDLVQKHLPDAKSHDPVVAATATIADLLGHRTGLQKADPLWLGAGVCYNNIAYGVLGKIIAKITGQPYHIYLQETILSPLGMTRTVVTKDNGLPENSSLAYSTLDNGKPYNVPLPGSSGSTAMGSAGGLLSSGNDLSKYYKALMAAWSRRISRDKEAVFSDISWIFTPLRIMETPALREKSYTSGWVRSQLPTTVGNMGVNPGLLEKMPVLSDGIKPRLALWHQGSLVGATSFVMMFPETESAVLVLTNTMALNDAADWIGQLLVETLLDSPIRNYYVGFASESAEQALKLYAKLGRKVKAGRAPQGPGRPLSNYVGLYVGFAGFFCIEVLNDDNGLEILFQGRQSQNYSLQHHHHDTFTWFMSRDEQIKRVRFVSYNPALYFIRFNEEEGRGITVLNWAFDAGAPGGEDFFKQ